MFHMKKLRVAIFGLEAMVRIAKFIYRRQARKAAKKR